VTNPEKRWNSKWNSNKLVPTKHKQFRSSKQRVRRIVEIESRFLVFLAVEWWRLLTVAEWVPGMIGEEDLVQWWGRGASSSFSPVKLSSTSSSSPSSWPNWLNRVVLLLQFQIAGLSELKSKLDNGCGEEKLTMVE